MTDRTPRARRGHAIRHHSIRNYAIRNYTIRNCAIAALAVAGLGVWATLDATAARASEVPSPATVSATAPHESSFARKVQQAWWRDRTCETPACRARRGGNLVDIASFGLAAAGGVLFSRRREG